MSHQLSTLSSGREVMNFGWPGAFPHFRTSIFQDSSPVDSQGKRCCQVFLGPNLNATRYTNLKKFLEQFNNAEFSGLVLTSYSGSLSSDRQDEVYRLIRRRVTGHIELRNIEPPGHEKVMKKIIREIIKNVNDDQQGASRISSSFSIHVDFLNGLPESAVQRLCTLDNLELVHLLAPQGSLLTEGGIDPCRNSLEVVWTYTTNLRKCILPLDLFDHLERAFEVLRSNATLEEVELKVPVNDEVLRFFHPGGRSYEPTMANLSRSMAQLTRLRCVTIPVSFVSPAFVFHMATLTNLITLTVVPVGTVNPLRHLLGALRKASIHRKGTGCFESLSFLDLGPSEMSHMTPDDRLELEGRIYASENDVHRQRIRTIFEDVCFIGDWLE